eukprot:gnl/MRDRNA2_/MRDRNA2_86720_c0_seq3.p1 gnl/MRDRNA2_/MRDRNA2_86720_c0~~gnl/MRDRNA2_/MRDRNA2_86720_c0_seq3.p1  ORF type:complete len:385 (+),score=69.93 gnl/MRDRNA2_/MRDRNA2_86720_c0_seq3:121-1275(+)
MVGHFKSSILSGSWDIIPKRPEGPPPKTRARGSRHTITITQINKSIANKNSTTVIPQQAICLPNSNESKDSFAQNSSVAKDQASAPHHEEPTFILGRNIGQLIGSGTFGIVYEARNVRTGHKEVMKKVCKSPQAFQEIKINCLIPQHPNVIQQFMHEACCRNIYIFMQYGGARNLYQMMKEEVNKRFEVDNALNIFCDILNAVIHIHEHDVCHLDVKPENVIWGEDDIMRLADFGHATNISSQVKHPHGSVPFAAPEVLDTFKKKNVTYWGHLADTFSVGVLLFEVVFGVDSFNKQLGWQSQSQDELLGDPDRRAVEMRSMLNYRDSMLRTQLNMLGESTVHRQLLLSALRNMLCPDASMRYPLMGMFACINREGFKIKPELFA